VSAYDARSAARQEASMKSLAWLFLWLIATTTATGLLCASASMGADAKARTDSSAAASDPRRDMITALAAPGPHKSLGDDARAFDQLVGTWDCDYSFYADDGTVTRAKGELLFGWILDGHAVQDIWITYPKAKGEEREIGTSVRFFDPKSGMWRVMFALPTLNILTTVEGKAQGDRIVLEGTSSDGAIRRWSFNDIEPDSFVWRNQKSTDGGKTWRLREEHHMTRRKPG
jgi:hypothetical protein